MSCPPARCKLCYAPFGAPFGPVLELMGFGKFDKNPSLCNPCMRKMEKGLGGAEIELSLLFADLRESTQLAAGMSAAAYSQLLNGFYGIAASAVQAPGGTVDKYLGDGIMALFIPGFAGKQHAAKGSRRLGPSCARRRMHRACQQAWVRCPSVSEFIQERLMWGSWARRRTFLTSRPLAMRSTSPSG